MTDNTTTATRSGRQLAIRRATARKINALIRQAGLNHLDIANKAKVSESQVSHTIRRRRRDTDACERVWLVLERIL